MFSLWCLATADASSEQVMCQIEQEQQYQSRTSPSKGFSLALVVGFRAHIKFESIWVLCHWQRTHPVSNSPRPVVRILSEAIVIIPSTMLVCSSRNSSADSRGRK